VASTISMSWASRIRPRPRPGWRCRRPPGADPVMTVEEIMLRGLPRQPARGSGERYLGLTELPSPAPTRPRGACRGNMSTELGEFLRSRRARLSPDGLGLPGYGRRRVPGLRREEVAQLAGMSADYYMRLEQGRNPHVSDQVLDAVARALRLTETERAHL